MIDFFYHISNIVVFGLVYFNLKVTVIDTYFKICNAVKL